jgi:hypothetical protein
MVSRLDPQRFGRIARCQLNLVDYKRFIVEARLGRAVSPSARTS